MPVKRLGQGRLTIKSGDATPLSKVISFVDASLAITEGQPAEPILNRDVLSEISRGPETPCKFEFSCKYEDKALRDLLREAIWNATAEALTGLTGGATNSNVQTIYRFRQGSLQAAASESPVYTKLAAGATPTNDREFAENVGVADPRRPLSVVVVPGVAQAMSTGGFDVKQPAADTTLSVVYDAVGLSTLNPGGPSVLTSGSVITFLMHWDFLSPQDMTTVLERIALNHAYCTEVAVSEGDPFNSIKVSGFALVAAPTYTTSPA